MVNLKEKMFNKALLRYLIPVFILIFITGCSTAKPPISSTKQASEDKKVTSAVEQSKATTPVEKAAVQEQGKVKKPSENSSFKQLAFQGKMEGVEFKVGSSYKEITDKLGKPQKQSTISGGEILTYGDASYIITPDTKKVVCIMVTSGKELYGVKVGMKPSEIKKVLGDPDFDEYDDLAEIWSLCYNAGDYTLIFNSIEEDAPTSMAFLQSATF